MEKYEAINYPKRYISFKEYINLEIKKNKQEIKEMKTYFEETDNYGIINRENKIKKLENIKNASETIIKDSIKQVGERRAYEEAYINLLERYAKL